MECTIGLTNRQRRWGATAHTIAVLGLVVLTATGATLESVRGWVDCPPPVTIWERERGARQRGRRWRCGFAWRAGWYWLRRSWEVPAARSEALLVLACLSERQEWEWVCELPWVGWLWKGLGVAWPRLVNAIESRHIPTTNNTTEEVIRIFTQHYKTFCGFENIESARLYLRVFEKVYRFTPFSDDTQQRIRGKCPLELADYDVQKLPMAQLFRGLALQWPASAFQELVPNV